MHDLAGARICLILGFATELEEEPGATLGQQREIVAVHALLAHRLDEDAVEALNRERCVREDVHDAGSRGVGVGIATDQQRSTRWAMHKTRFRLEHGDARAFRAHQRPRHVEAVLGQQLVEVVARDRRGIFGYRWRIRSAYRSRSEANRV
jgi:hypothetical protein